MFKKRKESGEKEKIMDEFLTAYNIISSLHRHKHKMKFLAKDKNINSHLRYLYDMVNYMQKDLDQYKEKEFDRNIQDIELDNNISQSNIIE